MAIDITASAGAFNEEAEPLVMRRVFDALLAAIDARRAWRRDRAGRAH